MTKMISITGLQDKSPIKKAFRGILASTLFMLVDPLFLYVPLINDEINCVTMDNRVKIAVLVLRSLIDILYIFELIKKYTGHEAENPQFSSLALHLVCVVPIPHVLILYFLPNMRGLGSLKMMKFLNFLLVLQYFVRAVPIYAIFKAGNEAVVAFPWEGKKIMVISNLCAFLLASHVLGAFWYFFSIQRQIDCWGHANRSENRSTFNTSCHENAKNVSALIPTHTLCPIKSPDASVFDFGIFLYALQSGMQGSTNFPEKFFQCLSWGLRNLSSFASNLNSSTYGWENVFVVVISSGGLVLFTYLLGHMQICMQGMGFSKRMKWKMKEIIGPRIQSILEEYSIPNDMESDIKQLADEKLKNDVDFILENLFSILSSDSSEIATKIKSSIFISKLRKVNRIKDKSEEVYSEMCKYLQPMTYKKGDYIFREGEPLDMMFFVTAGSVIIYKNNNNGGSNGSSGTVDQLESEKDYLYGGEELITWAEEPSSKLSKLPISPITVKCRSDVEIFALQDSDLQLIVSKFPSESNMDNPHIVAIANDGVN